MKFDLHVHTDISDSNLSIEKTVALAEAKRIDYLAIMDHDTFRAIDEAKRANKFTFVNVIGGLEISAYDYKNKAKVHILAYNADKNNKELLSLVNKTITARNASSYKSVDAINKRGIMKIDIDEIKSYEGKTGLYKQHILHYLVDKGYDTELFGKMRKELFAKDGYARFEIEYPDALETVDAVMNAGGIPVLAHPYIYNNMMYFNEMYEAGLMGLEAGHPHNNAEQTEYLINLCREKDLYITCGSDYHGDYGEVEAELGGYSLKEELIMPFINNLKML